MFPIKIAQAVAADLKLIYTSSTEAEAEQQLMAFAEKWDKQYPIISKSWMAHQSARYPVLCLPI